MFKIARLSTVRMIIDTAAQFGSDVQYTEWDGHAEDFKLPNKDLVGLVVFSCTENDKFHDLNFGIGIMVIDDPSLVRATNYADLFYQRLQAQKRFPMFNDDGSRTGFEAVIFDGTSVSPMTRVDYRPTFDIQVSARVTRAGTLPAQT